MAADITQSARAEIPPAAPFEWQVRRVVRTRRCRTEPHFPVQRRRNRVRVGRSRDTLWPILIEESVGWAICPRVDFANVSDCSIPNHFAQPPSFFGGLALVAHLRCQFV